MWTQICPRDWIQTVGRGRVLKVCRGLMGEGTPATLVSRDMVARIRAQMIGVPAEEVPLAIIQGPAGTAKTFYALAAGLEQVLETEERPYRKILVCRPNAQFDADIGFLPGSEQEKISPLMRPIVDNLEILLDLEGKKKERHQPQGPGRGHDRGCCDRHHRPAGHQKER